MSHRNSFTEDYEFTVEKVEGYDDAEGMFGYSVSLPHQCDAWEIIGAEVDEDTPEENNGCYPAHPCSKELAVAQMELFIKRANEALQKLKDLV
jgi:hypothetical protein